MSEKEPLTLYFIPSLVATLWNREKAKGSPLTEAEVLAIRDSSPVVAVTQKVVIEMDEKRGYKDIDPEHCWEAWLDARVGLVEYERGKEKAAEPGATDNPDDAQ
jgi:hypothetical protein